MSAIVITGGPGAGKTSLLDRLSAAGFTCLPEAGRAIIQEQTAIGGRGLPGLCPELFAELMLCWELRSYRMIPVHEPPVFSDRGIPDIAGYLWLEGLPVPKHVDFAARNYRYHRRVFVAPPWREIYRQDAERKQSFEEAARTCDAVITAYRHYGYELVQLPRTCLEQRLQAVTEALPTPLSDESATAGRTSRCRPGH